MATNGINGPFNDGLKVKLQNRGAKSSGITWELKSVFDDLAKKGLIKDTDGKGLTKEEALNLYKVLNEMHQNTNRATNYTRMQVGQEFNYTAEEMAALAKAAGYEIAEQTPADETPTTPPLVEHEPVKEDPIITGPPEGENTSVEDLQQQIRDNKAENKDLRSQIREQRKEERLERREERRAERAERREARQEARAERQLAKQIEKAEADFSANGQVGKIVNGKYFINGKEVTKEIFEVAKTKASSAVKDIPQEAERTMSDEQLAEYLKNDANYQKYKNTLSKMDNTMRELETKYNFKRGNFRGETDMNFADTDAGNKYSQAKWNHNLYTKNLPKYENEMATWKDGPCGKESFYKLNSTTWTNLERITLTNGQKAWKTDQGTFYPGPNGMPGHEKVQEENL